MLGKLGVLARGLAVGQGDGHQHILERSKCRDQVVELKDKADVLPAQCRALGLIHAAGGLAQQVQLGSAVIERLEALINERTVVGNRYNPQNASEVDTEAYAERPAT